MQVQSFTGATSLRRNGNISKDAVASKRAPESALVRAKEDRPWEFGRFVKTIAFFNAPSFTDAIKSVVERAEDIQVLIGGAGADTRTATLVTGATGGVGKRVVALLLKRGARIRALARDADKAASMLRGLAAAPGARLELVVADLSRPETMRPELFTGVGSCISCAAAKIRPKDSDAASAEAKYNEGVKFYDSRVTDDTPKAVDSGGMAALVQVLSPQLATRKGRELLDPMNVASTWGPLDDVVMGGRSESGLFTAPRGGEQGGPAAVFRGFVTEAGNGGFASVRSRNFAPPLDLSGFDGIKFRVKGDGQRYKLTLRTSESWDGVGYCASVDTKAGEGQDLNVAFSSLIPVFRARTSPSSAPFDRSHITSIQIMLSKFEYDGALNPHISLGSFELPIQSISAYTEADTPRFVHVSSAGVTRPSRPDLAPEALTKIVQMNDMLGGLLTYKLEGEDILRDSGIPFAIVRPCALTEEPAGAPVVIEQGDNISGKISRDDVAELCVHLLQSRAARDTTFEVKSDLPVGQPFTRAAPLQTLDWEQALGGADLKAGVTGKLESTASGAQSVAADARDTSRVG